MRWILPFVEYQCEVIKKSELSRSSRNTHTRTRYHWLWASEVYNKEYAHILSDRRQFWEGRMAYWSSNGWDRWALQKSNISGVKAPGHLGWKDHFLGLMGNLQEGPLLGLDISLFLGKTSLRNWWTGGMKGERGVQACVQAGSWSVALRVSWLPGACLGKCVYVKAQRRGRRAAEETETEHI